MIVFIYLFILLVNIYWVLYLPDTILSTKHTLVNKTDVSSLRTINLSSNLPVILPTTREWLPPLERANDYEGTISLISHCPPEKKNYEVESTLFLPNTSQHGREAYGTYFYGTRWRCKRKAEKFLSPLPFPSPSPVPVFPPSSVLLFLNFTPK